MEETRHDVTADAIVAFFHEVMEIVQGAPVHFVLNIDEMGYQEWATANTRHISTRRDMVMIMSPFPCHRRENALP
jgi:hypothetical protein